MENKLGIIDESKLDEVEEKIIDFKIDLLDDYMTFNSKYLDLNLLVKIHKFLFDDIYESKYLNVRTQLDKEDYKKIEDCFEKLNYLRYLDLNESINEFYIIINDLWNIQIFYDGNTRTLLAFMKLYFKYYRLPLECNICNTKQIKLTVNKKMLTPFN